MNGDTNVLTGANDVIVVRNSDGDLYRNPDLNEVLHMNSYIIYIEKTFQVKKDMTKILYNSPNYVLSF